MGSTIAWLEREPAQGETRAKLLALCHCRLHAGMRRIDLTCLIASPIMAGCLMTFGSMRVAIVAILLWNLLAWWPECTLLELAQHFSPALR